VRARRLGFADSRVTELTLAAHDTVRVEIRLAVAAVLMAPLEVVSRPAERHTHAGLAGFYERVEQRHGGWFLTREQIENRWAPDAGGLLYGSGVTVHSGGRSSAGSGVIYMERTQCPPEIYLDGQRLTGQYDNETAIRNKHMIAAEALGMINISELEGVEVYRGAATIPGNFGGTTGRCGVVLFWTKRGA
jgi:hypothetical protein